MASFSDTLPEHFQHYIGLVEDNNLLRAFENQTPKDNAFFQSIDEEKSNYKYAPGKWTIKEVLQHCIDSERIFVYRALAIARGEKSALPGFDAAPYIENAHANDRKWADLVEEYKNARQSTIDFVKSLNEADLKKEGHTAEYDIKVGEMLFVTIGHNMHHINILKEKYL